jgi:hypothetical protein
MEHDQHRRMTCGKGSWRAGCGGSRTSGSGDGPEKPTRRKTDRALRPDPTSRTRSSTSVAAVYRTTPSGTEAENTTRSIEPDGFSQRRTNGSTNAVNTSW